MHFSNCPVKLRGNSGGTVMLQSSLDGTFRTSRDVLPESGMRIKADVGQPLWIYGFML